MKLNTVQMSLKSQIWNYTIRNGAICDGNGIVIDGRDNQRVVLTLKIQGTVADRYNELGIKK